uniref:Uncharacterized protein n=1 Tax=Rhizophora mucronata TaxID=61149 RepID=A0A2P2PNK4_RHIMU
MTLSLSLPPSFVLCFHAWKQNIKKEKKRLAARVLE